MAPKVYNVGVIGYGMSAKVFHIPLILSTPSFHLHSIVQRSPTSTNDAGSDHPNAAILPSTSALFSSPEVDLVVITTTPDSHFDLASAALAAGKHVLVEKPFVPTAAEASKLIELAQSAGKLICVYQNRRWDTDFLTFRALQRSGDLGRIVEFETHFDRLKPAAPTNWKGTLGMADAGGVLYDLGTHLIDQIVVAFGVPAEVSCVFANQRGLEGEPDSFTALLRFQDGLLATAKAGVMSVEAEQLRYWVRGTEGSWKKFHLDVQEDQLKAGMMPADAGFGEEPEESSGTLTTIKDGKPEKAVHRNVAPETYARLYEGFAEAIEKGDASLVPVKASEARDVLRVIEALREGGKTGATVKLCIKH